jgi:hypothetical protein
MPVEVRIILACALYLLQFSASVIPDSSLPLASPYHPPQINKNRENTSKNACQVPKQPNPLPLNNIHVAC